MTVNVTSPLPSLSAVSNQAATVVNLVPHFDDPQVVGSVLKFNTVMGSFFVELFNVANGSRTAAPLSAAQFLNHVNNNLLPNSTTERFSSYDNSLVHRVDTSVGVIQGGGFVFPSFATLPQGPSVTNEYSDTRPNTRGTIAFAKQGGNPNSATNQWFINTKDNTTVLGPTNNGGFTTFGQVLGSGMTVVDAIAALPVFNATSLNASLGSQFPLRNTPPVSAGANNVVLVNSIRGVPEVVFTATSNNAALVNTAINDGELLLNFGTNQAGTATITVRATDVTGAFIESSFAVTVGAATAPPTIASLTTSATRLARGKQIAFSANGVADAAPGSVTKVEFYRDSNNNGTLDPGVDVLLGIDTSEAGGWNIGGLISGVPTGNNVFFARAVDNLNQASAPVSVSVEVTNNAPTLRSIPTLGTSQKNQATTLTYETLAFYADEADPNGDPIRFRIEQVLSGTLTKNGLPVIPGATTISPGEAVVWTPPLDATGTLNVFSFRASDGEVVSSKTATLKFIVNQPPVVSSISSSPRPLTNPGGTLTLSAKASDPDGLVTLVEFYRDTNNNGVLDVGTDLKLGQDTDPAGGWGITTTNTAAFPTGDVRYFARATDNTGQISNVISAVGQVNVPPTLGAFTATTPVVRPAPITLALADVIDAGGSIKMVEFFLDTDASSTLTANDPLLGKGVLQAGTNTYSLTLPTTNIPAGTTRFIARVTDNHGGVSTKNVTATITGNVTNTPPTLAALAIKPIVANRGQTVAITASGVADPGGGIHFVEFWRDNGDGVFNSTQDTLLAKDYSIDKGWNTTHTIQNNLAGGPRKFFARAVDFDGAVSEVKSFEIQINPPPTIASLSAPVSLPRGSSLTLSAVNVADTLGGTIKSVEFFHDTNKNGTFDADDKRVATGKASFGNYLATISTKKLDAGSNRFFARAIDNNGAISSVVTAVVSLT